MAKSNNANRRFNFDNVKVLAVDENQAGLDILAQILTGFGVRKLHAVNSVDEARQLAETLDFELVIVEQEMAEDKGIDFIKWLRRLDPKKATASAPVVVAMGHTTQSGVIKMRDCGANFVVQKPLSPTALLQRIVRAVDDPRPFVTCDVYAGPDRRFKYEGPPPGSDGRRSDDMGVTLGEPSGKNLDQDDINSLLKPRKVQL